MRWAPFTVHFHLFPAYPGKRFEHIRELQRIGVFMYHTLAGVADLDLALPSGGGAIRREDITNFSSFSKLAPCMAVKPAFGEVPAQAMVTGFYSSNAQATNALLTDNTQAWPQEQLISGGKQTGLGSPGVASMPGPTWTGNRAAASINTPATQVDSEVKALRSLMESALNAGLPGSITYKTFRIDYCGIIYGDRGFHFPQ